jgi:hypothetical protein
LDGQGTGSGRSRIDGVEVAERLDVDLDRARLADGEAHDEPRRVALADGAVDVAHLEREGTVHEVVGPAGGIELCREAAPEVPDVEKQVSGGGVVDERHLEIDHGWGRRRTAREADALPEGLEDVQDYSSK